MSPALRLTATITALSTAGFAFAAAGDPPIDSLDLGAMKLKPRAAAPAAAVGAVGGAVAPAPSLLPKSTATPGTSTPTALTPRPGGLDKSVVAPGTAPASTQSAASPPGTTAAPAQSGIGTLIQSPIGSKRAIDIVAAPASNKPEERSSTDVQVKMPSMFRK